MHTYDSYPRGRHTIWFSHEDADGFEITGNMFDDIHINFFDLIRYAFDAQRRSIITQYTTFLRLQYNYQMPEDLEMRVTNLETYRSLLLRHVKDQEEHLAQSRDPARYIRALTNIIRSQAALIQVMRSEFVDHIPSLRSRRPFLPAQQKLLDEWQRLFVDQLFAYDAQIILLHAEYVLKFGHQEKAREIWGLRSFGRVRQDPRDLKPLEIMMRYRGTAFAEDEGGAHQNAAPQDVVQRSHHHHHHHLPPPQQEPESVLQQDCGSDSSLDMYEE